MNIEKFTTPPKKVDPKPAAAPAFSKMGRAAKQKQKGGKGKRLTLSFGKKKKKKDG